MRLLFSRTKASLGPTLCNICRPYVKEIQFHPYLHYLPFHFATTFPQCNTMEPAKRIVAGGAWDRFPEEIISLITVKVVETSEAPLEDLCTLRQCNKATKRASSSHVVTNCFNLEHHYQTMDWSADYLQTVDWLQGVNNGGALFIKGMGDICMGRSGGVALLTRVEEEGDLQASYVLAILKYYKHGATDDIFNHMRHVYGEVTFGSQVRTR
jgi:hypothetical protein